jgi:hypothetical protein
MYHCHCHVESWGRRAEIHEGSLALVYHLSYEA